VARLLARYFVALALWVVAVVVAIVLGLGEGGDDDIVTTSGAALAVGVLVVSTVLIHLVVHERIRLSIVVGALLLSFAVGALWQRAWLESSGDESPFLVASALALVLVGPASLVLGHVSLTARSRSGFEK
jgi:hypothetical protein